MQKLRIYNNRKTAAAMCGMRGNKKRLAEAGAGQFLDDRFLVILFSQFKKGLRMGTYRAYNRGTCSDCNVPAVSALPDT